MTRNSSTLLDTVIVRTPPREQQSKETLMVRLIFILILVWTTTAHAKNEQCEWTNDTPCVVIYPKYKTNSNALGDKVSPTITITKSEIEKHDLTDLTKVLSHIRGVNVTQSGPTGQHSSVFIRGTNSNHTLVLLNGIPINDYSTPTGAHDIGQDFMSNVYQVDVYKGSSGAHWGADAVGGAINFKTVVDHEKKVSVSGNGEEKNINGNYFTNLNGYDISITAGQHQSKKLSALSGADEKDGTDNKSVSVNVSKWYDLVHWRTTWFARNTFTDLDGHNLSVQNGKWADNTFYALQTGLDYKNTSLTFHTHEYDRDYDDAHYESQNYTLRGTQQYENFGFGFDYKHNESLSSQQHNLGYFFNTSYNIFTYHHRFDEEHETYKLGFFKQFADGLSLSGSTSTSYKDKTTWTPIEYGETQELTLTKNNFSTTIFKNDINDLNSDGVEFNYDIENFNFFASHLNSKNKDTVSLRRPDWTFGFVHTKDLENNFSLITNYKYKGEHLDIHNSNWSTISMPDTHLLDVGITKNYYGLDVGFKINNILNEKYQAPHGFSQDTRKISFVLKSKF